MADISVGSTTAASAALLGTSASTTSSSSTSSTAVTNLSNLNDEVATLIEQTKLNNAGKVASFEKETNDVRIDNNMTARDIGILRKNDSRLNLFSSLTVGDTVDVFRFKVTNTANTKLGTLIAEPEDRELIRIQLFSKSSGTLIADQDPDSGEAYANFQALEAGTFELDQGDYVVRVSRMPGEDPRSQNAIQYAVQLTQGVYKNDYDTVEKGESSDLDQFGFATSLGVGTDQLISGLSAASSFISNLPAIGTPATSKLTGALYDALF